MAWLPTLVIVAAVAAVAGHLVSRLWIVRRYRARQLTQRTAWWLMMAVTAGPYLALLVLIVIIEPGAWWVAVILLAVVWPLMVYPSVVAINGTRKPE